MRTQVSWILAAAAALAAAACNGESQPPKPSCEIVSPANGADLTGSDDVNAGLDNIQVNVAVRTSNVPVGSELELFIEGGTNVPPQTLATTDGAHTFAGVTLPAGPVQAKLTCHVLSPSAFGEVTVNVGKSCALRFLRPIPGQSITRATTRPGPDGRPAFDVVLEATGLEAGAIVTLRVGEGAGQIVRQATLSPDRATFEVPVYHGANTRFSAEVAGTACEAKAEMRVNVDLGQCVTALSPGNGSGLGLADDVSNQAGLQTRVCLTTECVDGSNAFLSIDGVQGERVVVQNGQACFDVSIPEGSREISGRVQAAEQNGVAPVATYCVDVIAPSVAVAFPTVGLTLGQADDQNPATPEILDLLVQGTTGATSGSCTPALSREKVEILVNNSLQDSFTPAADGAFARIVRLPQGENTVQVCAYDQVGNSQCGTPIPITVNLPVPTLRIQSPLSGAKLLRAADSEPSTPDTHEFDVVTRSTGLDVDTVVTLEIDHGLWVCTGNVQQSGSDSLATIRVGPPGCTGLPDGTHRLVAKAEDDFRNVTQSQEVTITVDNHPPNLSFTAPAPSSQVATATVEVVLLTDAEDGQEVKLQGPTGELSARVSGGGAVFAAVPIQPGANTLTASVADRAGNGGVATLDVVRDSTPPGPSFVNVSDGRTLGAGDDKDQNLGNGFQFDIVVSVPNEPNGTAVTLHVGDRTYAGMLSNGTVTFTAELAEGSNVLRVAARDGAGNVGSRTISVQVQTGRPEATIRSPADGSAFSGLSDLDPATAGFQLPVSVSSNAQAPTCFAIVDPGANEVRWSLNRAGAGCNGVVTLSEGPHVIVATVESGGQTGRSPPVNVVVDSRPPVLTFLRPAPSSNPLAPVVFSAGSTDVDGRPGFQTSVLVQADDIEEGQAATLSVISEGGGTPATYTSIFDRQGRATFPSVTLPDQQRSTLQATARDRAGNESSAAVLSVAVDREKPTVRIVSPVAGQLFGAAGDESAAEGFQKSVTVEISGLEPGQAILLELGAPNGATPVTSIAAVVAAGQTQLAFLRVDMPVAAGGGIVVLTATARDLQGNTATDAIAITIDLAGGTVSWFSPSAGISIRCSSDDFVPTAEGFQQQLQFRVSGWANGAPVTVKNAQGNTVGSGIVTAGAEFAFITVTLPDGEHVLQATVVDPAGNSASTPDTRTIRIDTAGPVVTSLLCNGDADGNGFLSGSEDGTPASTSSFEMSCTVTFADGSAAGRQVQIVSTAPQAGAIVGSATATGTTATVPVSLAAGASPIGHSLTVKATDACNNPSSGTAQYNVTVDMVPPTVQITLPVAGSLLAANDRDPSTPNLLDCCTGQSGPFDITAQISGTMGPATLKVNGVAKAQATVATDGFARFANAPLEQGSQSLVVETADPAGNRAASAPVVVLVDSIPPKITITSPTSGESIASNAVNVSVTYSDVEVGRSIRIFDNGATVGSGTTSAGGSATIQIALAMGAHTLRAEVSDVNNNVGTSAMVNVTVTSNNPVVVFETPPTNPAFLNRASGTIEGGNMLRADLSITTSAAAGTTAYLIRNGTQVASATVTVVNSVNRATFMGQIFGATETGTLQARVRVDPGGTDTACPGDANNFCSVIVPFTVDIAAPTLTFAAPSCKAFLTAADAQAGGDFAFTFSTDAEDGQQVTLSTSAGAATATANVVGGSATTGSITLPQGVQTLTAKVSDRAGNETSAPCATDVDILPPTAGLGAARSPSRRTRAVLTWTMPGDDGTTGRVTGYELRMRACAAGQACPVTTTEFESGTTTDVPNPPALADGGTAMMLNVDELELERTFTFALRATDDAGNRSAIATASISTAFASESIAGPAGENFYAYSVASGHFANDGSGAPVMGLVSGRVGAASFNGGIRVVYSDGRTQTDFTSTDTGSFMGLAVANAGDVDGDGFDDLLVGAPAASGGGKAFLFFGGAAGLDVAAGSYLELTPPAGSDVVGYGVAVAGLGAIAGSGFTRPFFAVSALDIFSPTPSKNGKVFLYNVSGTRPSLMLSHQATLVGEVASDFFGRSVCGVGDVTGDGISDLVVGATREPRDPPVNGFAYVYYGNASFGGATPVTLNYPPTGGFRVAKFQAQTSGPPDWLGYSCARAGNLDGMGMNDFVIGAPGNSSQAAYAYRGRADLDTSPPTGPDAILRVTGTAFPAEIAAGEDVDGDGLPDVVIADYSNVHIFRGSASTLLRSAPSVTFMFAADAKTRALTLIPNWKDLFSGEAPLPDLGIANVEGPSTVIRY